MLNKVKISLTVWTAAVFALKALPLQEPACSLLAVEGHVVLVMAHALFWSYCVQTEGSTCHFPGGELSKFFLWQHSLGLFVAVLLCSSPHLFCPLDLPTPFCFSSFFFLQLPFLFHHCCHHSPPVLPSFALRWSGFLLSYSPEVPYSYPKLIGQSPPSFPVCCLAGLRSELCCLEGYPIAFTHLFLVLLLC